MAGTLLRTDTAVLFRRLVPVAVSLVLLAVSLCSAGWALVRDGAGTATTADASYDSTLNLAPTAGVRDDQSSIAERRLADALGDPIASTGELHAPRAPMRLPVGETWGNPNTLARHFRDHGADFAARSADEYAGMASDFFQRSQLSRLPTKVDADGVIRVYDPATNTFGAFNPSGTTRTFFTPKRGIDYWYDQPGNSPWGP